jgi:hypothetical protein
VLSLVTSKIAGAVPTVSWLQVLESEMRGAAPLSVCPYWAISAAHIRAEVLIGGAHELFCAFLCEDSALRKEAILSSITADMLTARHGVLRAQMLN